MSETSCVNLKQFRGLLKQRKAGKQHRGHTRRCFFEQSSSSPSSSLFGAAIDLFNQSKPEEQRPSQTRRIEQPPPSMFDADIKHVTEAERFRRQYLSKISTHKAWVPQSQRKPAHQTVIIFDWDDTLLYTTFIAQLQGRSVPEATMSHLSRIEKTAYKLLETALGLGQTFIITNAVAGWVEESAAHYMPSLLPILQRVRIISARSTQEANCDGDVSQWKIKAFLEMGEEFDANVLTNLVSIGDSNFELDAANVLGQQFAKSFIKTVKLKEYPFPQEHTKELELLETKLQAIVEKACDLKVKLERKN
jgi:hypothetical protein